MDCKECQSLVQDYIADDIPPKKMEEFIEHVMHCPDCYDELETYYTISIAIKYLDEDQHASYNMKQMLADDLRKKLSAAKRHRRTRIFGFFMVGVLIVVLACVLVLLLTPNLRQELTEQVSRIFR